MRVRFLCNNLTLSRLLNRLAEKAAHALKLDRAGNTFPSEQARLSGSKRQVVLGNEPSFLTTGTEGTHVAAHLLAFG